MAKEEESKSTEINLDELTHTQALQFLVNAIRQIPFSYNEHIQLEQCRRTVEQAIS